MNGSWSTATPVVRNQVTEFCAAVTALLGDDLVGIYLHGSLAMDSFHPARSDLDLLVVSSAGMTVSAKRHFAEMLLSHSNAPHPIEMSVVCQDALTPPLGFPLAFELHYSEDWRARITHELADGRWRQWNEQPQHDPDLAAHLAVIRQRGICLVGQPIAAVIPEIPADVFAAAAIEDVTTFALPRLAENPVYFVLNACRADAYLQTGAILSKDEGGEWALAHLPAPHRPPVERALATYRGLPSPPFDSTRLHAFATYMLTQLRAS